MKPMGMLVALAGPLAISVLAAGLGGWAADDKALVFKQPDGKVLKEFRFELNNAPNAYSRLTGGSCGNGKFAWIDRRTSTYDSAKHSFQFYGSDGQMLWEKTAVVGVTVSKDCTSMVLMEADPVWLAKNEHGNSPYKPMIYDNSGNLIMSLSECSTFSETAQLGQRYGAVYCAGTDGQEAFSLLFDLSTKKRKRTSGAGVEIKDDGSYVLFTEQQEFNPKTKKYGKFVRKEVGRGKFE